jgi:hypothetical protein
MFVIRLQKAFLFFSMFFQLTALFAGEQLPLNIDQNQFPTLFKYVQKHRCSPEIEDAIKDAKMHNVVVDGWNQKDKVYKYDDLPLFKKEDALYRIEYARRIGLIVKEDNLEALKIPEKCITVQNEFLYAIAREERHYTGNKKISKKAVEQILTFKEKSRYIDDHSGNFFRNESGQFVIIDTDNQAFRSEPFMTIPDFDNQELDEEAKLYIEERRGISLLSNPKYHDPDINFIEVLQEYETYMWKQDNKKNE